MEWSADHAVVQEVRTIGLRFSESLANMEQFLTDAEHGFQKVAETWTSIRSKFARVGPGVPLRLEGGEEWELEPKEVEAMLVAIDASGKRREHYPAMLGEMALISLFAIFDALLSDLLTTIFRARPEILRSGKQLAAETILSATSLDDLVEELISREVEDWRQSFRDQIAQLDRRFGLCLSDSESEIAVLSEAHARRHLFVHRGGVVDARYIEAVPDSALSKGMRLEADVEYWRTASKAMRTVGSRLAVELPGRCLCLDPAELQTGSTQAPERTA